MIQTADILFQKRLKRWANYFVFVILLIALTALAGWEFDIKAIIHPLPKLPPMNPATGVAFAFYAASFLLLTEKNKSPKRQRAGKILAFLVTLIGTIKVLSFIFKFDTQVDSFLFHDQIFIETPVSLYAHMSPIAALCFAVAGIALLSLQYETVRKRAPAQYMALIIGIPAMNSFLIYLFTAKAFYGDYTYVSMAIHTGISFILVALSLLLVTCDNGWVKELTTPFLGSTVARQLIPIAVLIPVIFGLVRLYLE